MTTSSSGDADRQVPLGHRVRWPGGARATTLVAVVLAAGGYPLARAAAGDDFDAMAALIRPPVPGATVLMRVVLLAAISLTAGIALARPALGTGEVSRGVRLAVRVSGVAGAAVCVAEALTAQASRPVAAGLVVLLVSATLLVPGRTRVSVALGALLGLVLALVLGFELVSTGSGGARLAASGYGLFGALLLGASVFGVAVLPGRPKRLPDPAAVPSDTAPEAPAALPGPVAGVPDRALVISRLTGIALVSGVLTTLSGAVYLGLTGPRTGFDAGHTAYGVASVAQAALPVLVTLGWLLARHPRGLARGAELTRLAAGLLVVAFLAGASLATLPQPAAGPSPGRALLRPVDLGLRHLAVLVTPMRPGANLVHVGDAGGGQATPVGHQHGVPAAPSATPGTLTVSAGGPAVPLTSRPGAPGLWAVVDIPAGHGSLTVAADGLSAALPIDAGDAPADPAVQRTLAGPDGPECATAQLGGLAAGHPDTGGCPSQALSAADAGVLSRTVDWLVGRGITTVDLAVDGSPRSVQAERVVREQAARRDLTVAATPANEHTLLVLSGWATGSDQLSASAVRAQGGGAYGGVVLAPWLFSAPVLQRATSEVGAVRLDPKGTRARQYALTLAAAFPGETPTPGGYLAWTGGRSATEPVRFLGAAQVNVPMGGAMDDMDMSGGPGDWYPAGTVLAIPDGGPPAPRP
jgi:hypothetical protein